MSVPAPGTDLVLVQGIYGVSHPSSCCAARYQEQRNAAVVQHGPGLGVVGYARLDGRGRRLANRLLQWKRGTSPPPHAVEIVRIEEGRLRASLATEAGRARWHELLGCELGMHDRERSFILMGRPYVQLEGDDGGQQLLWFGNGLDHLSRAEFIRHYTCHHGPLVAGYANLIGLRSYRQVPDEEEALCAVLRELGLGQAPPPAVFGQLAVGLPTLSPRAQGDRRAAGREIASDEQRHINFRKSMLLLARRR